MDLKQGQALPIWWSFLWRTAAYGVVVSFLIRVAAYFLGKTGAVELQGAMNLANILSAICYLPVSFVAMRQSLSKHVMASDA